MRLIQSVRFDRKSRNLVIPRTTSPPFFIRTRNSRESFYISGGESPDSISGEQNIFEVIPRILGIWNYVGTSIFFCFWDFRSLWIVLCWYVLFFIFIVQELLANFYKFYFLVLCVLKKFGSSNRISDISWKKTYESRSLVVFAKKWSVRKRKSER